MSKTNTNAKSAMANLADAQRLMLSAAAQREDHCLTRPASQRGAQILKMRETLIEAGYVREVKAKPATPVWGRDGETEVEFAQADGRWGKSSGDERADASCLIEGAQPPNVALTNQSAGERSSEFAGKASRVRTARSQRSSGCFLGLRGRRSQS
jgi:hypothetical protein